jgi:hypothetical protein
MRGISVNVGSGFAGFTGFRAGFGVRGSGFRFRVPVQGSGSGFRFRGSGSGFGR